MPTCSATELKLRPLPIDRRGTTRTAAWVARTLVGVRRHERLGRPGGPPRGRGGIAVAILAADVRVMARRRAWVTRLPFWPGPIMPTRRRSERLSSTDENDTLAVDERSKVHFLAPSARKCTLVPTARPRVLFLPHGRPPRPPHGRHPAAATTPAARLLASCRLRTGGAARETACAQTFRSDGRQSAPRTSPAGPIHHHPAPGPGPGPASASSDRSQTPRSPPSLATQRARCSTGRRRRSSGSSSSCPAVISRSRSVSRPRRRSTSPGSPLRHTASSTPWAEEHALAWATHADADGRLSVSTSNTLPGPATPTTPRAGAPESPSSSHRDAPVPQPFGPHRIASGNRRFCPRHKGPLPRAVIGRRSGREAL